MKSAETPPSEPSDPIKQANAAFYEKATSAFRKLFDSAKVKNELHFASSVAPEFRGMQDAGWNTALEAQVAFQQYLQFIQANPDDAFKARVALAFYSHLAEASGFYEVPKNMLRVAGGERYNVWPFEKLVEKHKLTGALIAPNANKVLRDLAGLPRVRPCQINGKTWKTRLTAARAWRKSPKMNTAQKQFSVNRGASKIPINNPAS